MDRGTTKAVSCWFAKEVMLHWNHHVRQRRQFVNDWLSSQLLLTDEAGQEPSQLEDPPLQAQHEHAGNGQLDEGTPFLQTFLGPTCNPQGSAMYRYRLKGSSRLFWMGERITTTKLSLRDYVPNSFNNNFAQGEIQILYFPFTFSRRFYPKRLNMEICQKQGQQYNDFGIVRN